MLWWPVARLARRRDRPERLVDPVGELVDLRGQAVPLDEQYPGQGSGWVVVGAEPVGQRLDHMFMWQTCTIGRVPRDSVEVVLPGPQCIVVGWFVVWDGQSGALVAGVGDSHRAGALLFRGGSLGARGVVVARQRTHRDCEPGVGVDGHLQVRREAPVLAGQGCPPVVARGLSAVGLRRGVGPAPAADRGEHRPPWSTTRPASDLEIPNNNTGLPQRQVRPIAGWLPATLARQRQPLRRLVPACSPP